MIKACLSNKTQAISTKTYTFLDHYNLVYFGVSKLKKMLI